MEAIYFSGGGCKGAFSLGKAIKFYREGKRYQLFAGTSVGALIIPLYALQTDEAMDRLEAIFTTITPEKIFTINPFKEGDRNLPSNYLGMGYNLFLRDQNTFGDSHALKELIDENFTFADYYQLTRKIARGEIHDVKVCVCNNTLDRVEYKSILDCDYQQFKWWIWASANFLPFMSLYTHNRFEYGDGGTKDHTPVNAFLQYPVTGGDAIVLRTEKDEQPAKITRNVFQLIIRQIDNLFSEVSRGDLEFLSKCYPQVNIHKLPHNLTDNPLNFNPVLMKKWYELGLNT